MRPLEKAAEFNESLAYAADGLYPYFRAFEEVDGVEVVSGGRRYLLGSSSDYLGLSRDPRVVEAAKVGDRPLWRGPLRLPACLTASLDIHECLERRAGGFGWARRPLCFSARDTRRIWACCRRCSPRSGIRWCSTGTCTPSLYDGATLACAETLRFAHNRPRDLGRKLDKAHEDHGGAAMVAVDSVYSMDGSVCPVREVAEICAARGVDLLVDEAHAVGTVAPGGLTAALGLAERVPVITGTLSKSLASMGGFVAASRRVVEHIRNHARPLIFTAALSPAEVAAADAALDIMLAEPERIERLRRSSVLMRELLSREGIEGLDGATPIIAVPVGAKRKVAQAARMLLDRGIVVYPVVSPAVPPGRCLLRISVTALHEEAHLDVIAKAVGEVVHEVSKAS